LTILRNCLSHNVILLEPTSETHPFRLLLRVLAPHFLPAIDRGVVIEPDSRVRRPMIAATAAVVSQSEMKRPLLSAGHFVGGAAHWALDSVILTHGRRGWGNTLLGLTIFLVNPHGDKPRMAIHHLRLHPSSGQAFQIVLDDPTISRRGGRPKLAD
jgi:hypothetical protein